MMKLGVCYYPEHWPMDRWAIDAKMMRSMGLEIVRIGEFAWAKMEPQEGQYDWHWLDEAIHILSQEGLKIFLCTPTATPPAWLVQAHEEILPVDDRGMRRRFGSRRHYCVNVPVYREATRQIVTAMLKRYGARSEVIGWQIDNELGCHNTVRCYCDDCAASFRTWLQKRYGSLEALNEAWGTVFWSQVYTDWKQIRPPSQMVTEPNASQVLDYWRFSSDSMIRYLELQTELIRSYAPGIPITTNLMGDSGGIDYYKLSQKIDFVSWDSYPTGYYETSTDLLYSSWETRPNPAFDLGDPYITGFFHAIMHGSKQKPFWVMEQQAGNINWGVYNPGIRPGSVRLWTWHAAAEGAEAVVFFRWRACLYAQEQFHSGLLHHDATPDVGAGDVEGMAGDLARMTARTQKTDPSPVALLYDYEDMWAMDLQPHRRGFSYSRLVFLWYRVFQRLGLGVDILPFHADLSPYRLVIAPTVYIGSSEKRDALEKYVGNGGHLLVGIRSGFKRVDNRVTDVLLPGLLRGLTGSTVTDWYALPPNVGYPFHSPLPGLEGLAEVWAEGLLPDPGVEALQVYSDGPFAGKASLTAHRYGVGVAYYYGQYPQLEPTMRLSVELIQRAGIKQPILDLPDGVIVKWNDQGLLFFNFNETAMEISVGATTLCLPGRALVEHPNFS